jgi:spore coat polysaccharide biosynthesis protein SpsF
MKTVIIVQARMASTRLPGKILKQVLGKTLLEYQIERLRRVETAEKIVIATTDHGGEQPIVDFCRRLGVDCFRGPENDVLSRYYGAATKYGAEIVVRITSDCPLIDPAVVDGVIDHFKRHHSEVDYVSNTFPELTYPRGMDTEVFSYRTLEEAYQEAVDQPEREHVTIFIKRHPERYRIVNLPYRRDVSRHRWTVDTPEDLELITRILTELYPENPRFTLDDCLELLAKHPEWEGINALVRQKLVK